MKPTPYEGKDAEQYLQSRRSATTDYVQTLRASLFADFTEENDVVLDFGSGTGGILMRLRAKRRIGVEIGEGAARIARENGVEIVSSIKKIPDQTVDKIISFHALEHVENPVEILRELARVAKPGGSLRLVVPCELPMMPPHASWTKNNKDRHLFTWTPLLFGNILYLSGFENIKTNLAPMPSASRLAKMARLLSGDAKIAAWINSIRANSLNVIANIKHVNQTR